MPKKLFYQGRHCHGQITQIKFLKSRPKATPQKVLNMLKTTYSKKSRPQSDFEMIEALGPIL